jgi:hypothetical protein
MYEQENQLKSLSVRITYASSENRFGFSVLWFSTTTKSDFRNTLQTHRISPESIFRFEMKREHGYEERPLEKLMEIVRG